MLIVENIEVVLYEYLKDLFFDADVSVYMERPEKRPSGSYIIIEKTGSTKVNKIPTATFAFQSYGDTLFEASELNNMVKSAVEMAEHMDVISGVTLNSDYNFTDTASKSYRYQAVFAITYYEQGRK